MSILDPPKYPRRWSEMSFEFKGLFVYHLTMMAMMIFGPILSVTVEIMIASALVLGIALLSLRRRRKLGWNWDRMRAASIAMAVFTAALIGFFLLAAGSLVPFANKGVTPWFLAVLGMGLFFVLHALHIVHFAETDFLADGQVGETAVSAPPSLPSWKKWVRIVYSALFLAMWLEGVTSFYIFGQTYRGGSLTPTTTQTEALQEKGHVVYVTQSEKERVDLLLLIMRAGIPTVLITGLAIHFGLRVPLFPSNETKS